MAGLPLGSRAHMVLARSERSSQRFYSMSAQIRQERKAYYEILEAMQKGELDITRWLEWFLDCLGRSFDRAETILATVLNKSRFWESFAAVEFNERQREIVNRLLNGFDGKLTSSKWAKLAKCSQDTALRDIEGLIGKKVLVKDAAGGRSTSYSLVRISELSFRARPRDDVVTRSQCVFFALVGVFEYRSVLAAVRQIRMYGG